MHPNLVYDFYLYEVFWLFLLCLIHKLQGFAVQSNYFINSIPQHSNSENPAIDPPSCPNCGLEMVMRTAKKGAHAGRQFWGCSSFPKCRGTISIS